MNPNNPNPFTDTNMPQYAYIPYAERTNLQNPGNYPVRIARYIEGLEPDIVGTDGIGMPNAVELESPLPGFSPGQVADIVSKGGQNFPNAQSYNAYLQTLKS